MKEIPAHQECRRCREVFPLDAEHFAVRPQNVRGYAVHCHRCAGTPKERNRKVQAAGACVNGPAGTDRTASRRAGTSHGLLERYEAASATTRKCGRPQLFARLKLAPGRYIHLLATRSGIVAREEQY